MSVSKLLSHRDYISPVLSDAYRPIISNIVCLSALSRLLPILASGGADYRCSAWLSVPSVNWTYGLPCP